MDGYSSSWQSASQWSCSFELCECAFLAVQVLLAVAQGAFIMTPEWVTASLEAGRWLPEEKYLSNVSPVLELQPWDLKTHMRETTDTKIFMQESTDSRCYQRLDTVLCWQVRFTETAERGAARAAAAAIAAAAGRQTRPPSARHPSGLRRASEPAPTGVSSRSEGELKR